MRNSSNLFLSRATEPQSDEDTTWSLPGGIVGFISWLLALALPFSVYGSNTLFFFLYTWPFFLALMPVAVVVGVAMHSLLSQRMFYSCIATLLTVAVMFGILFLWLLG